MQKLNPKQYVELFHLLFIAQLNIKLDKELYVIKGGCNMRFFFSSIRYSEDLDIDVRIIAKETLSNKINGIFRSTPFRRILLAKKIKLINISEPKQIEATQRWKIALEIPSYALPIRTKIEFSRRDVDKGNLYESISPLILKEYQLTSIMGNHYSIDKMFEQKIKALIGRTETQARDIFDIFHLIGLGVENKLDSQQLKDQIKVAQMNAMSISFEEFKGHVLAYLTEDHQQQYNSKEMWEHIVNTVIETLEKM